jgi:thiol-disulfide isomerase/thioredoxin
MKIISRILLITLLAGCFDSEPARTSYKGKSMPEFKLFLVDSSTYFSTASLRKGQPVIFFYFGPGCPYCRGQMDDFIDNASRLKDVKIVLLTTSPFEEMKWFYKHYQLEKYRNMVIGIDYMNFFNKYFHANGVPYIAIYDRDKKFKEAFDGKVPVKQLRKIALN